MFENIERVESIDLGDYTWHESNVLSALIDRLTLKDIKNEKAF